MLITTPKFDLRFPTKSSSYVNNWYETDLIRPFARKSIDFDFFSEFSKRPLINTSSMSLLNQTISQLWTRSFLIFSSFAWWSGETEKSSVSKQYITWDWRVFYNQHNSSLTEIFKWAEVTLMTNCQMDCLPKREECQDFLVQQNGKVIVDIQKVR